MYWLRIDLIVQLITCISTVLHTTYGITGATLIMCMFLTNIQLNLKKDIHRYIAYSMNGVSIILSTGHHTNIIINWLASFSLFGIGILYTNNYTHTLFHFYNHYNMTLVWSTF